MRSGGSPERVIVVSGMKKKAMAPPWISVGIRIWRKSVSTVNCARIHSTMANTMKASVAILRGSQTLTLRPTTGVSTMASRPTGASAMPAAVEV